MKRLLMAILMIAATFPAWAMESAPVSSKRAVATLVTDTDAIQPGKPFRVALRLRMADGWHTYWKNPGDAGVASGPHDQGRHASRRSTGRRHVASPKGR